jgi:hypothetical protein
MWVNVAALAVALCLGLYLVTRSPRSRPAWLAALTLWALAMLFFNNALGVNQPGSFLLPWLRRATLFALPCWAHMAAILRWVTRGDGSRSWLDRVNQVGVPFAYLGAVAMVLTELISAGRTSFVFAKQSLYLSDWAAGSFSPLAAGFLLLLGLLAMVNLTHGRRASVSRQLQGQFTILLIATILAALGALYIAIGVLLRLSVPSLPGDLLIGISVTMLGYAVARYNALLEGRVIKRDLLYVGVAVGSLTLLVVLIAELLHRLDHQFSSLTVMLIVMVAISTLMLYDGVRSTVDRLFFRSEYRQLRSNLRLLARDAGSGLSLDEQLAAALNGIGRELGIRHGLIAVREEARYQVRASRRSIPVGSELPGDQLPGAETAQVDGESSPLAGPALLVPFDDGREQIGVLILGRDPSARPLDEGEVALVEEVADQLALLVLAARQQEDNAARINQMVVEFRQRDRALQGQMANLLVERSQRSSPPLEGVDDRQFTALVEESLRRLYDYAFLGEHPLATLQVVVKAAAARGESVITHLDRGKALNEVLRRALNKLRPDGDEPARQSVPGRQWHQYLVLHDAYVLGEPNRDIMGRLYVGEGTFNRTRRRAIRSVARALREMEEQSKKRSA